MYGLLCCFFFSLLLLAWCSGPHEAAAPPPYLAGTVSGPYQPDLHDPSVAAASANIIGGSNPAHAGAVPASVSTLPLPLLQGQSSVTPAPTLDLATLQALQRLMLQITPDVAAAATAATASGLGVVGLPPRPGTGSNHLLSHFPLHGHQPDGPGMHFPIPGDASATLPPQ